MANIKTREKNKGTIKTLDRASIMHQHIKQNTLRVKDHSFADKVESDSPENYASDKVTEYGKAGTIKASYKSTELTKDAVRSIKRKKDIIDVKKRKDILLRSRNVNKEAHSPKIKTPSEAQKISRIKRNAALKNAGKRAAAKSQAKTFNTVRKAEKNARKAAVTVVRSIKLAIEGTKALILAIGAGGTAAVVVILICILFGAAFYFFGDESSSDYIPVSPEVEAYSGVIQKYANEYGIGEYTELIKAVMMQESGGRGKDPMQAAEGPFNKKYPKKPNGITDPNYSIECGVQELKSCLNQAGCKSPVDMEHIKLALQGYNYGNGYISWAIKRDGGYTPENAIAFSDQQAKKHGWKSYGDKEYTSHVLRYYPYGNYSYDVINTGPGKLGLPIKGMTQKNISSHFGPRYSPGGIGSTNHQGLDIAFPTGTKVLACESGKVTTAGWNGGYGKCVIIEHSSNLKTVYGHLNSINVKNGQKVVRGQVIGTVGSTGNSTGPHLHLGVMQNGSFVNPEKGWLSIPK